MVITISREFGSGGRELGAKVAKLLGYKFFDKEILKKIQEDTGFSSEYINATVENDYSNFLYSGFMQYEAIGLAAKSFLGERPGSDVLQAQTTVIEKIADDFPNCVIIGRCADYILRAKKPFRVFVYSANSTKCERCRDLALQYDIKSDSGISDKKLVKYVAKINKKRAKYYRFCTGQKWGDRLNYDLLINTTGKNIDDLVAFLADVIKAQEK